MDYFFGYTYEPDKNCLEVAVYSNTTDDTLMHIKNLTAQLFAAITFDFTLKGDPRVGFFRHAIKEKINLDMKIMAGGQAKKESQAEMEKKLFGKNIFPAQIEVEVGVEQIMLVKMTIIPDVSINSALSALHVRGFLRRGYFPGKLYPGMYGEPADPIINLFGLRSGQTRDVCLVHNGGWYNKTGELLGAGDLSAPDFVRIAREIIPSEIFLITSEQCSDSETSVTGAKSRRLDYILEHVIYGIITLECLHNADATCENKENKKQKFKGIHFTVIGREELKKIIKELPNKSI